jgi:hypothetical protein
MHVSLCLSVCRRVRGRAPIDSAAPEMATAGVRLPFGAQPIVRLRTCPITPGSAHLCIWPALSVSVCGGAREWVALMGNRERAGGRHQPSCNGATGPRSSSWPFTNIHSLTPTVPCVCACAWVSAIPKGGDVLEVVVSVPTDAALRRRIHRTVEYVLNHGAAFEVRRDCLPPPPTTPPPPRGPFSLSRSCSRLCAVWVSVCTYRCGHS